MAIPSAGLQREPIEYLHHAKIDKNAVILDGMELKGKKKFQIKYPGDINEQCDTDIGLAELTLVMDIILSPSE